MKNLLITIMLTAGALLISGCSSKNPTVEKTTPNLFINNETTTFKAGPDSIIIENTLDFSETYMLRECRDETVYCGVATTWYLPRMFGFEGECSKRRRKGKELPILLHWVGAFAFIPYTAAQEIVSLQPFWDYKDIRTCDDYEDTTEEKKIVNAGTFSGSVLVQNADNTQNLSFDLKQSPMPINLSLKDERDMFAVSNSSINTSNGYSVKIDGYYTFKQSSVKVQHEQQIK